MHANACRLPRARLVHGESRFFDGDCPQANCGRSLAPGFPYPGNGPVVEIADVPAIGEQAIERCRWEVVDAKGQMSRFQNRGYEIVGLFRCGSSNAYHLSQRASYELIAK
tara:strand:+ start:205 stop:534 length:330 start_codon:yes stop_codon:yes gene_type:complete